MDIDGLSQIKVSRDVLSQLFRCDVRTITNYANLYGMPRDDRGEYPFLRCLIWFIDKQIKDLQESANNTPLNQARQKALEINNERKEMLLQKERNELLDRETVELIWTGIIKMLMTNLGAIAPRLTKKLNGDAKTLQLIREEIDEYRNLCANTDPDYLHDDLMQLENNSGDDGAM